MVEEWKLNIDSEAYEKKLDYKVNRPPDKKLINRHDDEKYWTISIKENIKWFPFLSITEKTDISISQSLLKFFAIFQMRLLYLEYNEEEHVVEAISIQCSNGHRNTGLHLKDKQLKKPSLTFC